MSVVTMICLSSSLYNVSVVIFEATSNSSNPRDLVHPGWLPTGPVGIFVSFCFWQVRIYWSAFMPTHCLLSLYYFIYIESHISLVELSYDEGYSSTARVSQVSDEFGDSAHFGQVLIHLDYEPFWEMHHKLVHHPHGITWVN